MLEDIGNLPELVDRLRRGADASLRTERLLRQLVQLELTKAVMGSAHFKDPARLLASAFKVYSQGPEDGMIAEVFRRIGVGARRFVEFGVESGLECNSAFLLVQGWSGAWIEGSAKHVAKARKNFRDYPVEIVNELVTVENADALITRLSDGEDLDLLSIDIDFNDYWVWRAITTPRPRLVVIEYNATLPPDIRKTVAYSERGWTGDNYFGASLGAMETLGRDKGYSLVGCSPTGVNAFFVRDDLVDDRFCAPFTAVNHYEPPRYALVGPSGHGAGMGPWQDV